MEFVYLYICMYVGVWMYICKYVCEWVSECVCAYVCVCVCVRACVRACVRMCMYIYMCVWQKNIRCIILLHKVRIKIVSAHTHTLKAFFFLSFSFCTGPECGGTARWPCVLPLQWNSEAIVSCEHCISFKIFLCLERQDEREQDVLIKEKRYLMLYDIEVAITA